MTPADILRVLERMPEWHRLKFCLVESTGVTVRIDPTQAPILYDAQAVMQKLVALLQPLVLPPGTVACEDCQKPYALFGLDTTLPDDQWEKLMPGRVGGGILCASCIVTRASRLPGAIALRAHVELHRPKPSPRPPRWPLGSRVSMMSSDPSSGYFDPSGATTSMGSSWLDPPPPPKPLKPPPTPKPLTEDEQARVAFFERFGIKPTVWKENKKKKR